MKNYLTLLSILTSVIMMAVGSYAAENITQFSKYEVTLMATLMVSLMVQIISIFWIIYTDNRMRYRKIIRIVVILFFICLPALSIYLHKEILTNFSFINFLQNKITINSFVLSLVIFSPGFVITYLFKDEQIIQMKKWWVVANGYNINKKVVSYYGGGFSLKRPVSENYFAVQEFDRNYNRVVNGMNYQSVDPITADQKFIRVRDNGFMGFANQDGYRVIPIMFQRVSNFTKNHKAIAQIESVFWTINENGQNVNNRY